MKSLAALINPLKYGRLSFAEEGEDIALYRIFKRQDSGFYVDIGAYDPVKLSNTYLFYRRGWRGIVIDARPGSSMPFRKIRPRDISLEMGISRERKTLTYYMYSDPSLNAFHERVMDQNDGEHLIGTREIQMQTLTEVLDKHLPPGQKLDFLSIDVEGMDLEILKSNDFGRHRPHAIIAEVYAQKFQDLFDSETYKFLVSKGYHAHAKTLSNVIFVSD